MEKISLRTIWGVLVQTGKSSVKDRIPKLAASLAYYTVFSLGPMMIVMLFLADLFWGRQAVEGRLYSQIRGLVGDRAALQIQEIISNASVDGGSAVSTVVGFVTLLIGSTTVFTEIQDSINAIWKLKAKPQKGWVNMVVSRLLSFSLVVGLGFLLLVSLLVNVAIEGVMDKLERLFPHTAVVLLYALNLLLTFLVIWLLFATIFKVLPDAVIRWKDVIVGASFTALLFMGGKFLITFYIGTSDIGSTYGTAGSLVVLLLWVFFSAIILYFGAEFTKSYAIAFGKEIRPNDYAVLIQTVQVESGKKSVNDNEADAEGATQSRKQANDRMADRQ